MRTRLGRGAAIIGLVVAAGCRSGFERRASGHDAACVSRGEVIAGEGRVARREGAPRRSPPRSGARLRAGQGLGSGGEGRAGRPARRPPGGGRVRMGLPRRAPLRRGERDRRRHPCLRTSGSGVVPALGPREAAIGAGDRAFGSSRRRDCAGARGAGGSHVAEGRREDGPRRVARDERRSRRRAPALARVAEGERSTGLAGSTPPCGSRTRCSMGSTDRPSHARRKRTMRPRVSSSRRRGWRTRRERPRHASGRSKVLRAKDPKVTDALSDVERARQAQGWLDANEPTRAFDSASAVLKGASGHASCKAALTRANAAAKKTPKVDAWPEAVAACEKEAELVTALYAGAKARTGKDPKLAIQWFGKVEALFPTHRLADDARFRAALLVAQGTDEGREDCSEQMLRTLPDTYPSGDMGTEALFRVALAKMQKGREDWEAAKLALDRIRRDHARGLPLGDGRARGVLPGAGRGGDGRCRGSPHALGARRREASALLLHAALVLQACGCRRRPGQARARGRDCARQGDGGVPVEDAACRRDAGVHPRREAARGRRRGRCAPRAHRFRGRRRGRRPGGDSGRSVQSTTRRACSSSGTPSLAAG